MNNKVTIPLTAGQIRQIVAAIDRSGPAPSTGVSVNENRAAVNSARALVDGRYRLVSHYTMLCPSQRTPLHLPFAPPWRVERFFGQRIGLFEPQDMVETIPHEGVCT